MRQRADQLRKTAEALSDRYEMCYEQELADSKSAGMVLRHRRSGARIALVSNEDNNKVFCIGFRTPPFDSTGVAHIIEHTVLCGSKKFPVKDPFIELAKGSLNTFLNAVTYPDKTLYPVASCNDKDFQNLMDVYMDAVLHPNIYQKKEIFMQEGWHYEIERPEDELSYNGIVYSEMKGAFSSPEQVLDMVTNRALFPDSPYGVESGGDPDHIPELTYEAYLDFHRRYYHPSNSYIYLYGDMDMEEKLTWLDREYLSAYQASPVDSEVPLQKESGGLTECREVYSIGENESEENNTYLSLSMTIGESGDTLLSKAMTVLTDVLFNVPGAPVKQALIDAGIGKDIFASYSDEIRQPVLSVTAKNASEADKDRFYEIVSSELLKAVKEGIREKSLKAAINRREFAYREADYGPFPKGLLFGIEMFNSWLYDDLAAFSYLEQSRVYDTLKEKVGTGYYEELVDRYLLHSGNAVLTVLVPEKGLVTKKEEALKERLAVYKAGLSQEELDALILQTAHLKEFQERPSLPEELETIPMLSRADLKREAEPLFNEEREIDGVKTVFHNVFTSGIAYVKLLFGAKRIPKEYVPYLGLLSNLLGVMDTGEYGYQEFSEEVNTNTGGIFTGVTSAARFGSVSEYEGYVTLQTKCLYGQLESAGRLMALMMGQTDFTDAKRLLELIRELKSRMQMQLTSAGHSAAIGRAMSYFSEKYVFDNMTGGISQYQFLEDLEEHFEERKQEIGQKLADLTGYLFCKKNLLISITADEEGYQAFVQAAPAFLNGCFGEYRGLAPVRFVPAGSREGFKTPGQVQYVAMCGNFMQAGFSYTGALKVVNTLLGYDYLWNNIRVKGGAYGCMCGFSAGNGNSYFCSYRDPNLAETIRVYEGIADYLENYTADEREMTKAVIGTFSSMDTPLNPSAKGARSLNAYLSGTDFADIQKERDEVLSVSVEEIRKTAALVRAVIGQDHLCVIGSEAKIEGDRALFTEVKPLIK